MAKNRSTARVVRRTAKALEITPTGTYGPGLHVCPWKNPWGGLELMAVGQDKRLVALFSVRAGWGTVDIRVHLGGARRGGGNTETLEYDDTELFSDFANLAQLGHHMFAPGVYRAPWEPRMYSGGVGILVIAPNGQRWGYHEALTLSEAVLADIADDVEAADKDGRGRVDYDYTEVDAIEHGDHRRLLRLEDQYKQDRVEYGKLIKLGAADAGVEVDGE